MHAVGRQHMSAGIALLGASVIAIAPIAAPPDLHVPAALAAAVDTSVAGIDDALAGVGILLTASSDQLAELSALGGVTHAAIIAISNLVQNSPLIIQAALDEAATGNLAGAFEILSGPVLAAAIGVVQAGVESVSTVLNATWIALTNLIQNAPLIIQAAVSEALAGDLSGALQTLTGPVLAAVLGVAQVALPPSIFQAVGAAGLAFTNLVQNAPLIIEAAITEALSGNIPGALETLTGPVLAAVVGVVQTALPQLLDVVGAAGLAISNLVQNAPLIIEAAITEALTGNIFGALQTLTGPVLAAVIGVVQRFLSPPAPEEEVESFAMAASSTGSEAAMTFTLSTDPEPAVAPADTQTPTDPPTDEPPAGVAVEEPETPAAAATEDTVEAEETAADDETDATSASGGDDLSDGNKVEPGDVNGENGSQGDDTDTTDTQPETDTTADGDDTGDASSDNANDPEKKDSDDKADND